MVCIGKQAVAQTNTVSSTSSTVSGTTTVDRTPSTASAPSVVINNQDVCSVASSMAIQSQILGIAGGTTSRDLNFERFVGMYGQQPKKEVPGVKKVTD